MADRLPVIYGLEFQSRALTARPAENERIQFLCGTQTLRNENQIHLVDYDEETGVLNKLIYPYPHGEIWDLCSSHVDKDLLAVCHGHVDDGGYSRQVNLVKLDGALPDESDSGTIEVLGVVPSSSQIQRMCWHPSGIHNQLVTVNDKATASIFTIKEGSIQETSNTQLDSHHSRLNYSSISWNPHHNYSTILITADSSLFAWDTRMKKVQLLLDHHHDPCIRDIDSNPNRPHYFVSCGDDCTMQFWDWKKLDKPLISRQDHSHWVWSVNYNLSYDQLVVSSSSDSQVSLARVASVASEPLQHLTDPDDTSPPIVPDDGVIAVYEEHEDSVYAVRWSTADAWVFASLSYDGRFVINHVPSNEKYAILTS